MKPETFFLRVFRLGIAGFLFLTFTASVVVRPALRTQAAAHNFQIFLPVVMKPYSFSYLPNPLNLPVRLDMKRMSGDSALNGLNETQSQVVGDFSRQVQAIIPAAGGVITTTAADGALFTLEIPEGALITDTRIMMIPVAAIDGKMLGGSNGTAVQLQPDGLLFYKPVTLTIEPSESIPVTDELTVSWHGDGQEFHRYPLEVDHPYPQVVFHLMHFSGFGYLGDGIGIPIVDETPIPTDPEDQFKQAAEELVRREREAQASGQGGDPNFHQNMIDLLRAYYNEIIQPSMKAAETDCDYAKQGAISKGLGWARQAELIRSEDELTNELDEVQESFRAALINCWEVSTEPCLNKNDVSQMQEVIWIARQGQILGLDFNLNTVTECVCTGYWDISAWELTFSVSYNRHAQVQEDYVFTDVSVDHRQSGTLLLSHKKGYPPYPGWEKDHDPSVIPSGTASIDDKATETYEDGETYNSSTYGSGIIGGDAYLSFDELNCTYDLRLIVNTHVTDVTKYETKEKDTYVINLLVLERDAHTEPNNIVLRGEGDFDAYAGAYINEGMFLGGGSATAVFYNVLLDTVGNGHATWTLRAIP